MAESRVIDRTTGGDLEEHRQGPWLLVAGFVVLAALVVALAYWAWAQQAASLTSQTERTVNAVAELKATQIAAWRTERYADAEFVRGDRLLAAAVADILAGRNVGASTAQVHSYLSLLQRQHGYAEVILVTPEGAR